MKTSEFKFYCRHCDQPLRCDVRFANRHIDCPTCLRVIQIPRPKEEAAYLQFRANPGMTYGFGLGALNAPLAR